MKRLLCTALLAIAALIMASAALASAPTNSTYYFDFTDVANTADNGDTWDDEVGSVDMTMEEADTGWTDYPGDGAAFANDSTHFGMGHVRPASGDTLNVPKSNSLGIAVRFKWKTPVTCGAGDSPNIFQAGRSDTGRMIKIQVDYTTPDTTVPTDSCSSPGAIVQCLVEGQVEDPGTGQKDHTAPYGYISKHTEQTDTSTISLVNNTWYNVFCRKGVETSGVFSHRLQVTGNGQNFNPGSSTGLTGTDGLGLGDIYDSNAGGGHPYVSVANKYAGPAAGDQFTGTVSKAGLCQNTADLAVWTCLGDQIP